MLEPMTPVPIQPMRVVSLEIAAGILIAAHRKPLEFTACRTRNPTLKMGHAVYRGITAPSRKLKMQWVNWVRQNFSDSLRGLLNSR